ncbi:DMT family transporter [Actinomadura barringtoniae]|uniref:DMT family transporter n=1 Tax=Actinomadura barringtoniae TaxID=1427535 RepID=UPI001FB73C80|nr:DMT family transporter [Actinomadura barringtoniae]
MNGIVAAFVATGLYYVGFAIFKLAADRMEPIRGNRIPHMVWTIVSNWVFLLGLALVLCGLSLQILALSKESLGIAVPIFMSGVIPLIIISMIFFGERLTGREWLSLLLIAAGMALLTLSIGNPPPIEAVDVPAWKLGVVVGPAILVPLLIMVFGDYRPDGRHARPVTGIAYGLSSGFPVGTAELAIKGWSDSGSKGLSILATPYPYVTVLAAGLGFGIMVMAFQRCRVAIVATVMTVAAKSYLLLMGTFMYDEPWPSDGGHFSLRLAALVLGAIGVLQFPRHRPVENIEPYEEVPAAQATQPPPGMVFPQARDPLAGVPLSAPTPYPGQQAPPPQAPPPRSPYAEDPLGQYRNQPGEQNRRYPR